MSAPVCRRCGTDLFGSRVVSAAENALGMAEGGGIRADLLAATSACSWNCLAVLAAQLAGPDADAAVLIVAERERQVTAEGYTPEGDDDQPDGTLVSAGIAYAVPHTDPDLDPEEYRHNPGPFWPWEPDQWRPRTPARDLVRAGALIAAEVDRDIRDRRRGEPF